MALMHRNFRSTLSIIARLGVRSITMTPTQKEIKKSVFISQSKDIYTNLALEDWLYRNFDFTNHHVLMLWQNEPCVVIGRHQNPWLETNTSELTNITRKGVKLARRNSGGGTVFHDSGNLNMTFFTPYDHYDRRYNLQLITRAVFREYQVKVDISEREDLILRDCKISGTASKLGRPNSYHHCTLLVNTNKVNLRQALQKPNVEIETNATQSIRSKVVNLCEENPKINVSTLLKAVGWEYLRTSALSIRDGGMEFANQQNGFHMINPTEEWFPGISEIKSVLGSWQWCYGKTPKFSITRSFPIPDNLTGSSESAEHLKVTIVVESGHISDISLYLPPGLTVSGFSGDANVVTNLKGHKFSEEALAHLEWSIEGIISEKDKFVTDYVRQVMTSV